MREPIKIIQKLLKNGYSQKEVAAMIGKAESTVSRILAGSKPRLDTAQLIWAIPAATLREKKQ
jgi:transcriptional regulator with XRE-family HTH domain